MVLILYLIPHDTLLQNAKKVYYIMRTVFYYKIPQFYFNLRQLLQSASILLENVTVITNCNVYYKMHQYSYFSTNTGFPPP